MRYRICEECWHVIPDNEPLYASHERKFIPEKGFQWPGPLFWHVPECLTTST